MNPARFLARIALGEERTDRRLRNRAVREVERELGPIGTWTEEGEARLTAVTRKAQRVNLAQHRRRDVICKAMGVD